MDLTEIALKCKEGDRNAFGRLYKATLPAMRKVVLRYVEDSDTAADILHDGYIVAMTSIESLKNPAKVEGWLATIMKNLALQEIKSRSIPTVDMSVQLEKVDISDTTDSEPELTLEDFDRIISELPEGYGKVFRLSVLEGLSHKEIGRRLGIAPNSSSSQLYHARMMLRRMIWQYRRQLGAVLCIAVVVGLLLDLVMDKTQSVSVTPTQKSASSIEKPSTESETTGFVAVVNERISRPEKAMPSAVQDESEFAVTDQENSERNELLSEDQTESLESNEPQSEDRTDVTVSDDKNCKEDITSDYALEVQPDKKSRKSAHYRNGWSILAHADCGEIYVKALKDRNGDFASSYPPSFADPGGDIVSESVTHHTPLSFGVNVEKRLSSKLAIETGLRYTLLRTNYSSYRYASKGQEDAVQKIHYLGVPLKLNYKIVEYRGFSFYLQGGGIMDIPVYGTRRTLRYQNHSDSPYFEETRRVYAPVQWSVEGGFGLQYKITPHIGIYAEPSVRYYFDTNSEIKTLRQDEPTQFALPVGLRFSW